MATTLHPTEQLSPDVALRRASGSNGAKLFTAVVYAWVFIRVIPIWSDMKQGGISPEIFLAINLIASAPYCLAWPRFLDSLRFNETSRIAIWGAILATSFFAPYTYFILAGENVPTFAWIMIIAFIAVGIFSVAKNVIAAAREANLKVTS